MPIRRKWILHAVFYLLTAVLAVIGTAVYDYYEKLHPLEEKVLLSSVDLKLARDSIHRYQKISETQAEEIERYHKLIPPGGGFFYPSKISHQFYIYGRDPGRYLEMAFDANKYFSHRRRKQGLGFQRIVDSSTPHENFLYEILDSLHIVPNDTKHNDENAQKILNFVNSIPYHEKQEYYVKMPIETLVEGRGHCADLAVLMHSLMITAGLDAMIVFPTNLDSLDHAMVGVTGSFNEDRTRTYFMYNGKKYFLCQPTGTDDKRYPILHKVGFSKNYPYSIVYRDSITIVDNKKEWLKRGG